MKSLFCFGIFYFLPEEQTENGLIKKHKQIENYNKGKNVKKVNLF